MLVEAAGVRAGDRVLDVAAGSGNAAIPAAARGADVVASDLTPELFDAGRRDAAAHGVELTWEEGDAEALPYDDGDFDTVLSCVGVMFAPHHQAAADELVRVVRPGGTVGGAVVDARGLHRPDVRDHEAVSRPPPPPGAQPPPLWGTDDHVAGLFGDRVTDLRSERRTLRVDRFASPEEFRDFFKRTYGPTIATYRHLGDDAERVAELDRALVDLAADLGESEDGSFVMGWEYLVVIARRDGDAA